MRYKVEQRPPSHLPWTKPLQPQMHVVEARDEKSAFEQVRARHGVRQDDNLYVREKSSALPDNNRFKPMAAPLPIQRARESGGDDAFALGLCLVVGLVIFVVSYWLYILAAISIVFTIMIAIEVRKNMKEEKSDARDSRENQSQD